jgi:hypothetical protein
MARLAAVTVAMLGTVCPDGWLRISPAEPYLVGGQPLIGAMAWSRKGADLCRDPRYVLYSMVTGPDTGDGELKLHGSAVPGPRNSAAPQSAPRGPSIRRTRRPCSRCALPRRCSSNGTSTTA